MQSELIGNGNSFWFYSLRCNAMIFDCIIVHGFANKQFGILVKFGFFGNQVKLVMLRNPGYVELVLEIRLEQIVFSL